MPKCDNHEHATQLDESNKSKKWKDKNTAELDQQMHQETCKDLGCKHKAKPLLDFKKIRVHFVYDAKHDVLHKERLAVDVHLTDAPLSITYSGLVSLKGIRLIMFLMN